MSDDLFEYEINAVEEAADAIVDLIERAVAAAVASYFYYPDDDKRAAQAVTAVPSWSLTRAERLINECGHRFRGMAADLRNAADETGLDFGTIARLRAMNAERAAKVDLRTAAFFHELEALVPEGKTVGDVLSAEQLDALARKHGITIGTDGQPLLAADAAE